MKGKQYEINIKFIDDLSESETAERENKIISILVKNAIKLQKKLISDKTKTGVDS